MRGSKPQTLIFTGCSHKAIGKHAGLSTAQLHQEFQQQVVKAKFLWSLSSSTKSGISAVERWEKRKINLSAVWRSCERQLVCSDRHSNYWGKPLWFKLLFYGWILVQNQKTEPFHYAPEKSPKLLPKWPKQTKRKTSHHMTSGSKPRWYETNSKRVKRELLSHAPTRQSLSFWSVVLPIKKLSYETLGQIKKNNLKKSSSLENDHSKYCISIFCWQWREILYS